MKKINLGPFILLLAITGLAANAFAGCRQNSDNTQTCCRPTLVGTACCNFSADGESLGCDEGGEATEGQSDQDNRPAAHLCCFLACYPEPHQVCNQNAICGPAHSCKVDLP